MKCWKCGTAVEVLERVGFRDSCPKCDRPLHVCRNCGFYDPAYHNHCRETMAELVADKDRPNFCEYFTVSGARSSAAKGAEKQQPQGQSRESPRDKLEELFKRK